MYEENIVLTASDCQKQHIHEVLGSTFTAERCSDPRNHRFAAFSLIDDPIEK